MKSETPPLKGLRPWNSPDHFRYISVALATLVWWLFMREDEAFAGTALEYHQAANVVFILVTAVMLNFYLKQSVHSRSREGRIIAALFCPLIGVSIFCALATPVAMIVDPGNAGSTLAIGFLATLLSPVFLFASWKAMLLPMILTCFLAERMAALGQRQPGAKRRKKLTSPAAAYLYSRGKQP